MTEQHLCPTCDGEKKSNVRYPHWGSITEGSPEITVKCKTCNGTGYVDYEPVAEDYDDGWVFHKEKIEIRTIDENVDTAINLTCHRETHRLDRLLSAFQKALTLAHEDNAHRALRGKLFGLHDNKGALTATWLWEPSDQLQEYIARAWEDVGESRDTIQHVVSTMHLGDDEDRS